MTKKKRTIIEAEARDSFGLFDKLRDELFQYRVEIQTYKRTMTILWTSISIIVAILGFFGYNRFEALLERVEQNANERLSKSDSLLSKVNTYSIDSLNKVVLEKTKALEAAISALEKGTRVNNELYKKLISGLPYNKRAEAPNDIHFKVNSVKDEFDIVYYSERYSFGEIGECYVIMGDNFFKERTDIFLVQVYPLHWFIPVFSQVFEVQSNYNRLCFSFSQTEQIKDYEIAVVLVRKQGDKIVGYRMNKPIFTD